MGATVISRRAIQQVADGTRAARDIRREGAILLRFARGTPHSRRRLPDLNSMKAIATGLARRERWLK